MIKICSVSLCLQEAHSGSDGYCRSHYVKNNRYSDPLYISKPKRSAIEKIEFVKNSVQTAGDDCIIPYWSPTSAGYFNLNIEGVRVRAHRYALSIHTGVPYTTDKLCLHAPVKCHNRACINPLHLRWGDASDNAKDKLKDGTSSRGSMRYNAKLTPEKVRYIRNSSKPYKEIAEYLGVSVGCVSEVARGVNWAWVK